MKKTIALFALSFVFVAFLNAQTDCTSNNTNQTVKEKPVNYLDENNPNPTDCTNPFKNKHYYMPDRFVGLTAHKSEIADVEIASGLITSPNNISRPWGVLCCGPPNQATRSNTFGDN